VSTTEFEIAALRRKLSEADELFRAIHDGEVDAFVLRYRDSYKVHTLHGADSAYRALVEGMRQGAATIASDGTILYANRRLCDMLETDPEDIVGRSLTECFGFDRATADAILRSGTEGKNVGEFVIRVGEQSIVAAISTCPLDVEGPAPVFCLVISDVSDKRAAEKRQAVLAEERAELSGIFSRLPFAVFVADAAGGIYYVNEIGEKLATLDGMVDKVRSYASNIGDEQRDPEEIEVEHRDGSIGCYRLYANVIRTPRQPARAVVVAVDVTHERQFRIQRERDDQLRETFVAILGHDLRTPLGAIQTAGDLMKRRARTAEDQKMADIILRATHRMKGLTDDMLDLASSRLGQGIRLFPIDVDLATLVTTVTEELASGGKADFSIESSGDIRGHWDPGRMTQVLSNLLGNAVAYGAPDKPVKIRIDGRSDEEITIEVNNQGEPIPADVLRIVFDPFRRGRSANNKRGIGLGLYIAEQIVIAHGGKIQVQSNWEEGTTFKLKLPRASQRRPPG
jgi:PAS domain S-box-containing protein